MRRESSRGGGLYEARRRSGRRQFAERKIQYPRQRSSAIGRDVGIDEEGMEGERFGAPGLFVALSCEQGVQHGERGS